MDALRKAFDEHSPSKKAEKITDYLMQGLKLGVTGNEDVVFSALDYVAIQSIMRLSKLKENISAFNLGEVDANSIITDFSFKAPNVAPVTFEQQTGAAREAYEQAGQSNATAPSDVMEATIELHSYIELDGDIVAEKVETRRVDMQRRMNGR